MNEKDKEPVLGEAETVVINQNENSRQQNNDTESDTLKSDAEDSVDNTMQNVKVKRKDKFLSKDLLMMVAKKGGMLLVGYLIAFMNWTFILIPILVGTLIFYEKFDSHKKNRIRSKATACNVTKEQLLQKMEHLPSWVMFPDREKAEWLNEIVKQMWPGLNTYIIKYFKSSIEKKIRKKYDSFRFEEIDFGDIPPKIDGVKVYNRTTTKDSIIVDFDIYYDGNCEVNFSLKGAQIGCLRDFQLSVEVRVVLKPLLNKMPMIGGIQIFFLNTPDIDFSLEGVTGFPGLSHFITAKIEEKLRKVIVFPNKFSKRFSKTVESSELKSLEPEGVLRVHIAEARNLEKMDVTGKSDPYVIMKLGAQTYQTQVLKKTLNPKWDYWCEFIILDPIAQQLKFTLYDQDELNEDDFLGSGVVEIKGILEGQTDQWMTLEGVGKGEIHLRFTWLMLSPDYNALDKALSEAKSLKVFSLGSSLLTIYVDRAQDLPRVKSFKKPDPYMVIMVGNSEQQKSRHKKYTTDPAWEQGFSFIVKNPRTDLLGIMIMDKQTKLKIEHFTYEVKDLIQEEDLQLSKREFDLPKGGKIFISMQLRVLKNELYKFDENELFEDSSEDDNYVELRNKTDIGSRPGSTKSRGIGEPPSSQTFIEEQIKKQNVTESRGSPTKSLTQFPSTESKSSLGSIYINIEYSEPRQKLMITVHRINNLPLPDPKDIPDPYVKLKLSSNNSTTVIKNRTRVIMDCVNPEFDETFEFLLSPSELSHQKLTATVKTKKKLFQKNILGQVVIYMKHIDFSEPYGRWYDIEQETESD